MKWEITRKEEPQPGDVRFRTRFAFLPTRVLSRITMTDHLIWLELYIEEQEYRMGLTQDGEVIQGWYTVAKTIHT